ncbi:hypothetical protein Cgig2_030029 [Carnegiea gigantea]|uniref:Transmembrane protein n=1 Tax=Carnegiea gigantea TaxID=171969 RepID=A0A9Q1K1W7_9CARY|nr:hypothetical protein Cgig2_030029 [Carnegiea gigantea]
MRKTGLSTTVTPSPTFRSADGDSSDTVHAADAPLCWWRVLVRAAVGLVGLNFLSSWACSGGLASRWRKKRVEGLRHRRRVWSTRHPSTADLMGTANAESISASHAANTSIRRRRVGVLTFVVMVLHVSAWIGIGCLEGRRRKKAVSRLLRRRHVLHVRRPSVADLMAEICF